ncbi:unnamed protein product [Thlaspi arvense]|uniref:YacP-like NYN domain protein n=1 Tax=Thlaspi arvense TaxID=13288 RepID=A0AAU9RLH4_THLAR|nr:unnamed protein product [Thlaspi arvense]
MKTTGAPPHRGGSPSSAAYFYRSSSSSSASCRVLVVKMGGKSKSPQSPSSKDSEPEPPRIKSNVKHNLQLLKLWKACSSEFQNRGSGSAKPATSYRKKKVEKDELPDDTELYRDPTNTLYYTNQGLLDDAVPVLLVDGYNVCGYWMKLKKHFMNGRLDVARQKLVDELVSFSMVKEVKVVVVFDALMSGLPTHKEDFAGVDVIFSGETCADSWIEKEGAYVWSSKALVSEIKSMHKEVEKMMQETRSTSFQGRLLKHNLDSGVVDALKDLRDKLSENESKR